MPVSARFGPDAAGLEDGNAAMSPGTPYFLTRDELNDIASDTVVLFGAGNYGEQTLRSMRARPSFFVDNERRKRAVGRYLGLEVKSPEHISDLIESGSDLYVVVCVARYRELGPQLRDLGLQYGVNCGITPVERDLGAAERLLNHDETILFSSYARDGGLYLYDFKTGVLRKVNDVPTRGFVRVGDFLYCCSPKGLHRVDAATFEENELLDLGSYNSDGIAHIPSDNSVVIAGTETDEIIFVDVERFEVSQRLKLSDKYDRVGRECHHVHDIVAVGDYVLASVFSLSGWGRFDRFDGGVLEIERSTSAIKPLAQNHVRMPHSLKLHNDSFYLLDSMNGSLIRDFDTAIAQFNGGYMRGLEISGSYCYVGQSWGRPPFRLKEESRSHSSIDAGVHLFDMENRISRFVRFEGSPMIYQISVWDSAQAD